MLQRPAIGRSHGPPYDYAHGHLKGTGAQHHAIAIHHGAQVWLRIAIDQLQCVEGAGIHLHKTTTSISIQQRTAFSNFATIGEYL